jgi:hypothetical protein
MKRTSKYFSLGVAALGLTMFFVIFGVSAGRILNSALSFANAGNSNYVNKNENVNDTIAGSAAVPQPTRIQQGKIEDISVVVARLGASKDLKAMQELEEAANSASGKDSIGEYTESMIKICGAYDTYDFGNPKQYLLARTCTKKALSRLEEMPIGQAMELVSHLGGDNEYISMIVPAESFQTDRTERAKYWLRIWQRLDQAIIKDYNFEENRPVYHSKMTASEARRAEVYNEQSFLRRDREKYMPEFRRFLVDFYSKPPFDISELNTLLQGYVADAELRKSLLEAVEGRMAAQSKSGVHS